MGQLQRKFLLYIYTLRLHRPVGAMLLFWPCAFGLALSCRNLEILYFIYLFLVGSFAMRGVGCIINDLWDKELDKKVERTRNRPIASGRVKAYEAIIVAGLVSLIGLMVLLQLEIDSQLIALTSMLMATLYPLMKLITFWPQIFLGLTFNIGVVVAYANFKPLDLNIVIVYFGCVFWTIGYDTIYAFQDIQDDQKVGIKSSARALMNENYKLWLYIFYGVFYALFSAGVLLTGGNQWYFVCSIPALFILYWQVRTLDIHNKQNCDKRFRSNILVGAILFLAVLVSRFVS